MAIFSPPPGFHERLIREGDPLYIATVGSSSTVPTGTQNQGIATATGPGLIGKAVYIEEVTLSLDKAAYAQWQIAASADARFLGMLKQMVVQPGVISIPVKQLFRGFNAGNNCNIVLSIRDNLTAGDVTYRGGIAATGWRITDDLDYDADLTMLVIGDSTNNGTGPTSTATMYAFLLKAWLLANYGLRLRVVLKAISGSTSSDHEKWRKAGWHDVDHADIILYAVSINDAGSGVSDGTYTGNLDAMWSWVRQRYIGAKMLVLGCTPLENNTSEARAVGLRAAAAAYVSSQSSPRLKFTDLGSIFDRTVSANYASSDTPGSRVHFVDSGHAAAAAKIETDWPSFSWSFQ